MFCAATPASGMSANNRRMHCVEVELGHVSLDRDGQKILDDVSWKILAGQRWVVLGANGAGKTQLLKIVAGAVWPNPDGRHLLRWRRGSRWQRSAQDLLDEIAYLGPERQDRHERHGWNHTVREVVGTGVHRSDIPLQPLTAAQRRRVERCMRSLRIMRLASRRFLTLSYGERRRVLLARALAVQPGLMLLDELLTGLDGAQRSAVMAWLQSARRGAMPWVLSAHRRADIPANATHLLILQQGRVGYCGPLRAQRLREYFAARHAPAPRSLRARPAAAAGGTVLFRFSAASIFLDYRPVLRDIDWEVRSGECWIVRGANGAGKSTLLRTIYGDHPVAAGGRLQRAGIEPGVPLSEFKQRCGIVAPQLQTDYPRDTPVQEVVISGLHASIGLNEAPDARERSLAARALELCGAGALRERRLASLSYGQVRRVLFARALVAAPRLLLLDEAFAGLDFENRRFLLSLVDQLVDRGVAVILATHLREELPASARHTLTLQGGRARIAALPSRPLRRKDRRAAA